MPFLKEHFIFRDVLMRTFPFFTCVLRSYNRSIMNFSGKALSFFIFFICIISNIYHAGNSPCHAGETPSGGKISISIWDFPRVPHPLNPNERFLWLREICDKYTAENPGVDIVITKLTWAQGGEKIKIATFAGVPPDITSSDIPLKYIEEGLIEAADDFLTSADRMDYFPQALEAFSANGHVYGFPWAQKTDYIYINRGLFKMAGVEPPRNGLWTYSEFLEKMKKISDALKIRPFGFNIEAEQTSELPFIFGFGGNIVDCAKMERGVKFLHDSIYKDHISSQETGGLKSRDIWLGFKEKQNIAAAPFGIWALPPLLKEKKIDFEIAQYPYADKAGLERGLSTSSVIGYFVFKQRDEIKRVHALKLARFITNAENQRILKYYGQFPTRRSVSSIYDDVPQMKKAFSLFEYSRPGVNHPALPAIDEALKNSIQKMLLEPGLSEEQIRAGCIEIDKKAKLIIAGYEEKKMAGAVSRKVSPAVSFWSITIFFIIISWGILGFFRISPRRLYADIARERAAYLFLLPSLIAFAAFFIMPVFRGILISFQDFKFNTGILDNLCGFQNYYHALSDTVFRSSAVNTLIYTAFIVPSNIAIALVLAVMLYKLSERVQTVFKGAFYLPGVVSIVTLCIVWRYIFDFNSGLLNIILEFFSVAPVKWLTSPEMSLFSIILFTVLKGPGGALLIYLTALCNIPKDYFEAAAVDGAGPVKVFFKITAPLLIPQTMFLAITLTIDAMQVFAPVMLLTEGGPANSSEVVIHRIYKEAFNNLNIGEASAMSVLLFLVILAASIVQYRYFKYDYY